MSEALALELLGWLLTRFGAQAVMGVFGVKAGSTGGMLIEEASTFIGDVLTSVRARLPDERIRAILDAQYVAADAVADAIEDARFGPRKP